MNDRDDDRRKAFQARLDCLRLPNNAALLNPPPPAEPPLPALNRKARQLDAVLGRLGGVKPAGSVPETRSKDEAETALETAGLNRAGQLFVYYRDLAAHHRADGHADLAARATGLAQRFRFRKRDFVNLRDGALLDRCAALFCASAVLVPAPAAGWEPALARLLADALTAGTVEAGGGVPPVTTGPDPIVPKDYQLTTETTAAFGVTRAVYAKWVGAPTSAIVQRKTSNQQTIPAMMEEADALADEMDRLVLSLNVTADGQPWEEGKRLVGEYLNATIIRNTGARGGGDTPTPPAPTP